MQIELGKKLKLKLLDAALDEFGNTIKVMAGLLERMLKMLKRYC